MKELAEAVRQKNPARICSALRNLEDETPKSGWLLEKLKELKEHLKGGAGSEGYRLRVQAYGAAFGELLLRTLEASKEEKELIRKALAYNCIQNRDKLKELAIENQQLAREFVKKVKDATDAVKAEMGEWSERKDLSVEQRLEIDDHLGNGIAYCSWLQLFMDEKK